MKLKGYISLMRPLNCFMMGLAVIVGTIIASGEPSILFRDAPRVVLGFITGFLLTASSMVVNDYIDREIDLINQPQRPIPSGLVHHRSAIIFSVLLGILGLATSFLTGLATLAVAFSSYAVALLYNLWGKKTGLLGNMMVSYTVTIPLLYGSALIGSFTNRILVFSLIIFLANTGREITKGIVDIPGDRLKGVRTLAVRYGPRVAASYAFSFYLVAIILSLLAYVGGMAGNLYLMIIVIVDIIVGFSALMLYRRPSRQTALIVKKRVLYAMLLGLIGFSLSSLSL